MPPSIDEARAAVEAAVRSLVVCAESDEKFAEFESMTWGRLLALGRAVVVLFLVLSPALFHRQSLTIVRDAPGSISRSA